MRVWNTIYSKHATYILERRSGRGCKINTQHKHLLMDRCRCANTHRESCRKSCKIHFIHAYPHTNSVRQSHFSFVKKIVPLFCLTFTSHDKASQHHTWKIMKKRHTQKNPWKAEITMWWFDVVIYFTAAANTVRLSQSFCQFGPPAANTLKAANATKPVNCDQFCLCRWRRTRSRSLSASISQTPAHTCTHTHARFAIYQKVVGHY